MQFSHTTWSGRVALLAVGVMAFLSDAPCRAQTAAATAASAPAAAVVADARASLPAAVRDAGVLRIATTFQWPPFTFQAEGGGLDGIDVGMVRLLAAKLGLTAEFSDVTSLPVMLGGVSTGRFDVAVGQMGITPERVKAVDFVPYFKSGYALLVQKGHKDAVNINSLCGHTLAITQGSAQVALVESLSRECVAAGKPEIRTTVYQQANLSQLAVANGRGEGFITGNASAIYNARGNPQLEVAPGQLNDRFSMVGIVVARSNPALRQALALALDSAVADGSYAAVLSRFDVADSALTPEQMHTPASHLAN